MAVARSHGGGGGGGGGAASGGGGGGGGTSTGTVMGGSPGISTTVEPTWGSPGIPGGGGGPGGGDGDGGGGAGATPLLTSRVTMIPGTVWPPGDVPITVPAEAALLSVLTLSATWNPEARNSSRALSWLRPLTFGTRDPGAPST